MSVKKTNNPIGAEVASAAARNPVILTKASGPGGKFVYPEWVKYVLDVLGPVSGDLGRMMQTNTRYVVPPVSPADYEPPAVEGVAALTNAQRGELRFEAEKYRNKRIRELKEGWPNLYRALWASISEESRLIAQAHATYVPGCNPDQDPFVLWTILRETHFTVPLGGGNEQLQVKKRTELKKEFALFSQLPGMRISEFKTAFDQQLSRLEAVGEVRPSELELSMTFIGKLDPARHSRMQVLLENHALIGMAYPATLQAAYEQASQWRADHTSGPAAARMSSVFLLADDVCPEAEDDTALVIPGGKAGGSGGKSGSKAGKPAKQSAAPAQLAQPAQPARRKYVETRTCNRCNQVGHLQRNCTLTEQQQALLVAGEDTDEECEYDKAFMACGECQDADEYGDMPDLNDSDDEGDATVLVGAPVLAAAPASVQDAVVSPATDEAPAAGGDEGDAIVFVGTTVPAAAPAGKQSVVLFSATEVILDCAAGQSVFRDRALLRDIRVLSTPRFIGGVNASAGAVEVTEEGVFGDLGVVGIAPGAAANLLSQGQLRDRGANITYDSARDSYEVSGAQHVWRFTRKPTGTGAGLRRFYTYDTADVQAAAMVATVAENTRRLTAREVKSMTLAETFLRRMGHMSERAGIKVLNAGVLNCKTTAADVRNVLAAKGPSIAALRGKTKRRASAAASGVVLVPRVTQVQQTLHVDIFFIKGLAFLLGIMAPLGLYQCVFLTDRGVESVGSGLQVFLNVAASRDFDIQEIRCDGEGAVGVLRTELQALGLVVNIAGAGEHVPVAERGIQTVKARVRAHDQDLPFVMTKLLLSWCTMFCVRCINLQPSSTSTDAVSPFEQFSGMKLDAKRDVRVAFGDYNQATVPVTDNTMRPRTHGCIALCPTGNSTGSVTMLCLPTDAVVVRNQFVIIPMPDAVIAYLNAKAAKQGMKRGEDLTLGPAFLPAEDDDNEPNPLPEMMPIDGREDAPVPIAVPAGALDAGVDVPTAGAADAAVGAAVAEEPVDEVVAAQPVVAGADGDRATSGNAEASGFGARWSTRIQERRGDRQGELVHAFLHGEVLQTAATREVLTRQLHMRAHWHDRDFAFNISVRAALRDRGEDARPVIMAELQQMVSKGVWHGVRVRDLTREQRRAVIRSSMFLKDKYLASGAFEKFKARLVAGGDQQNKGLYENLSSPTAASASVMAVAAIAAMERRHAVVIDIGGAFLNADMAPTGIKVHMRLDRIMTAMLLQIDPSYKQFVEENGTMVVELDKALYGCVEAAALWYKHLRATLLKRGFTENPYDLCVFNMRTKSGAQITIALHVDDLFVTCLALDELESFYEFLNSVYKETKIQRGKVLDYLGMTFDFSVPGEVKITMAKCVEDILAGCGVDYTRATPAAESLFDVRETTKATAEQAKRFHSLVAKLLYLAKRVRADCLTAIAFLTTRVQACDIDDVAKLNRVLAYLRGTRDRGIVLRVGPTLVVRAYIDAAYGVHQSSGKSHTGCVIMLGEAGPVLCKSAKQKIVTKSSTEAELVGLSDTASPAIHMRNFLRAQGHDVGPVVVYQDNMSAMALVRRGGPGSERSRHINIRHFWLAERVAKGEVMVVHMPTEEMIANLLTKPVQGAQFVRERDAMTNWV